MERPISYLHVLLDSLRTENFLPIGREVITSNRCCCYYEHAGASGIVIHTRLGLSTSFLLFFISGLGDPRGLHQPFFFCNRFVSVSVYKLCVSHVKPVVGVPLAWPAHPGFAMLVSGYYRQAALYKAPYMAGVSPLIRRVLFLARRIIKSTARGRTPRSVSRTVAKCAALTYNPRPSGREADCHVPKIDYR